MDVVEKHKIQILAKHSRQQQTLQFQLHPLTRFYRQVNGINYF